MKNFKKYFFLIPLFLGTSFIGVAQEKVKIGNFTYIKNKVKFTIKDDNGSYLYSTCDQYSLMKNQPVFTVLKYSQRNDTIFEKGFLSIDYSNKIIKQKDVFYFDKSNKKDSTIFIFKQRKDGGFVVKRISDYKNGIEIKRSVY